MTSLENQSKANKQKYFPYANPVGALLELTSACNLRCKHCANAAMLGTKEMSDNEFLALADELKARGLRALGIGGGEPLLREGLLRKIIDRFASSPQTSVSIATNGLLLSDEFLQWFVGIPNDKHLQISIDGGYARTHDWIRGRSGAWQMSLNSLLRARSVSVPTAVSFVVNAMNSEELLEIAELCTFAGVRKLDVSFMLPAGAAASANAADLCVSNERRKSFTEDFYAVARSFQGVLPMNLSSMGSHVFLEELKVRFPDWLIVRPNGDVRLDCSLPFVVGSVAKDSLEALWRHINECAHSRAVFEFLDECASQGARMTFNQDIGISSLEGAQN